MNKSDITNIITVLIMVYGYSNNNNIIYMVGLFALKWSYYKYLSYSYAF